MKKMILKYFSEFITTVGYVVFCAGLYRIHLPTMLLFVGASLAVFGIHLELKNVRKRNSISGQRKS